MRSDRELEDRAGELSRGPGLGGLWRSSERGFSSHVRETGSITVLQSVVT